jgi:hypothetical protein
MRLALSFGGNMIVEWTIHRPLKGTNAAQQRISLGKYSH